MNHITGKVGNGYEIYASDNANENTPVVVSLGTGNGMLEDQQKFIEDKYGENVIIVLLKGQSINQAKDAKVAAYNELNKLYGFDGVADAYMGASNRGSEVVALGGIDLSDYVKNNNGKIHSGASFMLLDSRMSSADGSQYYGNGLNSAAILSNADLLSESGSKLYIYTSGYSGDDMTRIENLASKGINCVLITSSLGSGTDEHIQQEVSNIANGAIPLSIGYTRMLSNADKYTFNFSQINDNGKVSWNTYKWSQLTLEQKNEVLQYFKNMQIASYGTKFDKDGSYYSNVDFSSYGSTVNNLKNLELFSMDKDITNDKRYAYEAANSIRTSIKNTTLLNNSSKNINCQSTTIVPTCAENVLYDYFSIVLDLSEKMALESEKIKKATDMLTDLDKILAEGITTNDLMERNLSEPLYNVTGEELDSLFAYWTDTKGHNPNSPINGTGKYYVEAAEKYGIDPLLLVSISMKETGFGGTGSLGYQNNNNFFGIDFISSSQPWGNSNKLYDTKRDGIMAAAKRISEFYCGEKGATTLNKWNGVGYAYGSTTYGNNLANIWLDAYKDINSLSITGNEYEKI